MRARAAAQAGRTRDVARRLVVELLAIGAVLGAGGQLPLDGPPGTSWAFLLPVALFVTHAFLGLAVLVDAVRIVARARGLGGRALALAATGLVGCLVAVVVGASSLAGPGPDEVRPGMTLAWLVGVAVYGGLWASSSAALRAGTEVATASRTWSDVGGVAAARPRQVTSHHDAPPSESQRTG